MQATCACFFASTRNKRGLEIYSATSKKFYTFSIETRRTSHARSGGYCAARCQWKILVGFWFYFMESSGGKWWDLLVLMGAFTRASWAGITNGVDHVSDRRSCASSFEMFAQSFLQSGRIHLTWISIQVHWTEKGRFVGEWWRRNHYMGREGVWCRRLYLSDWFCVPPDSTCFKHVLKCL